MVRNLTIPTNSVSIHGFGSFHPDGKPVLDDPPGLDLVHPMLYISKVNSSPRVVPDGLPAPLIKAFDTESLQALLHVYNVCMHTGHFPSPWRETYIVPLHKTGSYDNPRNFRLISILSPLAHVMERWMYDLAISELLAWIPSTQFSLCPGVSVTSAILSLLLSVSLDLASGEMFLLVKTDVAKAFDTVSHASVTATLWKVITNRCVVNMILSYVCQQKVCTRDSQDVQVFDRGVPQG